MHDTEVDRSPKLERDPRIDFFRGCALLIIAWNHTRSMFPEPSSAFASFLRPLHVFLFDGADIFVYLSGYVYGLVHWQVMDSGAIGASIGRSVVRAWELYVANLVAFAFVLALFALLYVETPTPGVLTVKMQNLSDAELAGVWGMLRLRPPIQYFGILILYIKILLFVPVLLVVARRSVVAASVISVIVWALPILGIASGGGNFDPLSWQLLFFIGILIGGKRPRLPRHPWIVGILVTLLVLTCVLQLAPALSNKNLLPDAQWGQIRELLAAKQKVLPVRIVSLLAAASIVALFSTRRGRFWKSGVARPLVVAGQHSLEVFAFGVVLVYAAGLLSQRLSPGFAGAMGISTSVCLLSLAFAFVVRARKIVGQRWRSALRNSSG